MRFGFLYFARDLEQIGSTVRLAEQLGFHLIGLPDSPALAFDPYIALTLAAQATSRVRLGPAVTNPQTRHPLIIANLAASFERLAPGRTFLGLGTGYSGVAHAGAQPASLAKLAETVRITRRLLAGEAAEADGARLAIKVGGAPVPILLAASGPRILRLAGEIADVALFNLGATPGTVSEALRFIAEGAEAAGRDPAEIESWLYTPAAIATDGAQARDEVRNAAVSSAAFTLRRNPAAKGIPPGLEDKIDQLIREYQFGEHLSPGHSSNYHLAERLGLVDYVLERFSLAGTPEECCRKIESLRSVGLENVCFNLSASPDLPAALRLYGEMVLPAFVGETTG